MRKTKEISDPNSCFNRAKDDEFLFVLLGRDAATPSAIRAWVAKRIELGKNQPGDPQITEALSAAGTIECDQVEKWLENDRMEMKAYLADC